MSASSFFCPILNTIMADPVQACDGYTYERAAIEEWFARHPDVVLSPLTGQPLANRSLVPNMALRSAIDEFCRDRPDRQEERAASLRPALVSEHLALQDKKVAPQEPWDFDKRALQGHAVLIVAASRASLNKGTGVLQVFAQSKDAQSFQSVASAPLTPAKKSSGEASVACMEQIDADSFAAGNRDGTLQTWNIARTGAITPQGPPLVAHKEEVTCLTLLDGFSLLPGVSGGVPRTLASGSRDKNVVLWTRSAAGAWQNKAVLQGHASEVRCVAAIKSTGHIVSGGNDWDLLSWDAGNPEEPIAVLKGHTKTVRCLCSNGTHVASGSEDETVKIWDPRVGSPVATLHTGSMVLQVQFGDTFLAAGGGTPIDSFSSTSENTGGWLRVFDTRTWSKLGDAALNPPSTLKRFTSTSVAEGDSLKSRQAHAVATLSLRTVTLNGHRAVVSGGDDKRIRIWGSSNRTDSVPFYPRPKLLFDFGGEPTIPISVDALLVIQRSV